MASITYRKTVAPWDTGKVDPLTIAEINANFKSLDDNKFEVFNLLNELTNTSIFTGTGGRVNVAQAKSAARTNLGLGGIPEIPAGSNSPTTQYLRGDGSWDIPPSNPGTVTSVSGSGSVAGLTLSGTVTSSGNILLGGTLSVSLTSNVTGTLPIANGGTGATNAGGALSSIGAAASVHSHSAGDINSGQFSISRMPRGTSGYLLQANGNWADPAWVATSGISVNNATSAGSATKLATARSINGTSFDGSADITTANWGTARTLTIGSTGKSVNGSAGVWWSLAEIGAAATSHTHSGYAATSHTHDYAATSHTHDYAATSHTHSGYAATSHTHNYAGSSIAGGPASSLYSTSPYQIGRLGVGTTPSGISGSINCTGTIYSSSNVQCAGVIPVSHNLYTLGIVGNTWKTIYCLDFFSYGTVYINQQGSSSDRRFKDNIVDSDLGLDFVLKLRPVSYTRIKNMDGTDIDDSQRNKINYGFIAQEVEEILNFSNSNLYIKNEGDQYFLCYDQFIAPLTKAVQEQQSIINQQKERIDQLEIIVQQLLEKSTS